MNTSIYKRLIQYKDLFAILIWRELLIRYKQTTIGVLWAILQPLSMMLLFVLVFGMVLQIETGKCPKPLFYFSGLVPWTFLSASVASSIRALTDHRELITKIYFPRELIIFSKIAVFFADFLISIILLFIMIYFYHIKFSYNTLWIIPLSFILIINTATISLLLGTLNVYYRDVKLASEFLLRFWFFGTPVFYSVDTISIKYKILLFLNPLTFIIENFRRVLIQDRTIILWQFGFAMTVSIIFFIIVYKVFTELERSFADVI